MTRRPKKASPISAPSKKVSDRGKVRLGSFSPSFPISAPSKKISDRGKVRLGSFSPSF
jgi:hypothetical protein